jgi:hypothetical protein
LQGFAQSGQEQAGPTTPTQTRGGGGGGGYVRGIAAVAPGVTYRVVVGQGGVGGTADRGSIDAPGSAGGTGAGDAQGSTGAAGSPGYVLLVW